MDKVRFGVISASGMAQSHMNAIKWNKTTELVAICDIDEERLNQVAEEYGVDKYVDYKELLKRDDIDAVVICTPDQLHREMTVEALKAGKHVLCEKPMALNSKDCRKMIRTSEKTGKKLMIAQVLRFDKGFEVIRKAYQSGEYGKLLRLSMTRVGAYPSRMWFRDVKRSGGAMMDLHLHDLDFAVSLLGSPDALISFGVLGSSGGVDDSVSNYIYENGPIVTSECSWLRKQFHFRTSAVFENGTLEYCDRSLTLHQTDKPTVTIELKDNFPYGAEVDYLAECVVKDVPPVRALPESTMLTVKLIEAELRSVAAGGKRIRLKK
jgi:predicted dehydrogenase